MTKKTILIALLALAIAAPVIAAETPAPAPKKPDFSVPKLKFETVDKFIPWEFSGSTGGMMGGMGGGMMGGMNTKVQGKGPIRPAFVVRIHKPTSRVRHFPWERTMYNPGWGKYVAPHPSEGILQTPTGKTLSTQQQQLIKSQQAFVLRQGGTIHLYGVDRDQTEKTAIAFAEYLADSSEKQYQIIKDFVPETEQKLKGLEKELSGMIDKVKSVAAKRDQIKRETHYLNMADFEDSMRRMTVLMETEAIKHDVLRARENALMQAIENEEGIETMTPPEKYNRQHIFLKLEELRIDLNIDLAESMATLQAANKIRSKARQYIDCVKERDKLEGEIRKAREQITLANRTINRAQSILTNPDALDMLMLSDSQLPIYPVSTGDKK